MLVEIITEHVNKGAADDAFWQTISFLDYSVSKEIFVTIKFDHFLLLEVQEQM